MSFDNGYNNPHSTPNPQASWSQKLAFSNGQQQRFADDRINREYFEQVNSNAQSTNQFGSGSGANNGATISLSRMLIAIPMGIASIIFLGSE